MKNTILHKPETIFLVLLVAITLLSCKKETPENPSSTSNITGSWVNKTNSENLMTLEKSNQLKVSEYGFTISSDGKFTERANAGWCGTPPITYADYEGTWTQTDSIIHINVDYWGGKATYKWKIISLENNKLTVRVDSANYKMELQ